MQAFKHKGTVTLVGVASGPMEVFVTLKGDSAKRRRWRMNVTTPTRDGEPANQQMKQDGAALKLNLREPAVFTLVGA